MSLGFGLNLLHVEYLSGIPEVELLNHESILFQALECIPDCSGGYTYLLRHVLEGLRGAVFQYG